MWHSAIMRSDPEYYRQRADNAEKFTRTAAEWLLGMMVTTAIGLASIIPISVWHITFFASISAPLLILGLPGMCISILCLIIGAIFNTHYMVKYSKALADESYNGWGGSKLEEEVPPLPRHYRPFMEEELPPLPEHPALSTKSNPELMTEVKQKSHRTQRSTSFRISLKIERKYDDAEDDTR